MTDSDCRLNWDIYYPFVPGRDLVATFYMGSPTVTQWRASLQPMVRSIDNWQFSFSLEFVRLWDPRPEIVARWLHVQILLNGTEIAREDEFDRSFNSGNWFKYSFQSNAPISLRTEQQHYLAVVIHIYLPDRARINEVENGLFVHEDDLRCLSRDLGQLLNYTRHYNMVLIPGNSYRPILVHSYIMDARWNSFFSLHDYSLEERRKRVETNISSAVLHDILTYMYSGRVGITWPDWTDPAYTAELFQVIDLYKLYHFYKVFVKQDFRQFRVTRNSGIVESQLFHLQFADGRLRLIDTLYIWDVEYHLRFQMHINENQGLPWLSYTLLSTYSSRVYAKVNLELVIQFKGGPFNVLLIFHEKDFIIEPRTVARSMRVLFLGCPETFDISDQEEMRYFIRCSLNITDGTTVEQIRNVVDDTLLNESVRFDVLSDHLQGLRTRRVDSDMLLLCRLEGPGPHYQENVHKGILAIRVPDWWEGLENVPPADDPPESATSILSVDSLPIVLDFMYTGKVFNISSIPVLEEIGQFAQRTRFYSLLDLVRRIHLSLRDR